MEPNIQPARKAKAPAIIAGVVILVIIIGFIVWPKGSDFCFNFAYDTQFGDKQNPEKASNEGFMGPGGTVYYVPETSALQTALVEEGFFIDEYERTGGGVYLTSFFGPSTKSAVIAFQEKNDLAPTGEVDNNMIDLLRERYGCAPGEDTSDVEYAATSTEVR